MSLLDAHFNNPLEQVNALQEQAKLLVAKRQVNPEECPQCGALLEFRYENNGFTMPNGPEHWEVTSVHCKECGYEE